MRETGEGVRLGECWGGAHLSGVDLLSVDGGEKLRLALLQLEPVRVDLQEAHPLLQGQQRLR